MGLLRQLFLTWHDNFMARGGLEGMKARLIRKQVDLKYEMLRRRFKAAGMKAKVVQNPVRGVSCSVYAFSNALCISTIVAASCYSSQCAFKAFFSFFYWDFCFDFFFFSRCHRLHVLLTNHLRLSL